MALKPDQQQRLNTLLDQVSGLADELTAHPEDLLTLLRQLEQLHRSIQDGPFRRGLPSDRNHLFALLKQMEQSGGWPYIPRLQLRTFMDLLQQEPNLQEPDHTVNAESSPGDHQLAA